MNFIRKYKNYIIAVCVITAALVFAFMQGGSVSEHTERNSAIVDVSISEQTEQPNQEDSPAETKSTDAEAAAVPKKDEHTEQPTKQAVKNNVEENNPTASDSGHLSAEEKIELAQKISGNTNDKAEEESNISLDERVNEYNLSSSEADHPQPADPNNTVVTDKQMTCTLSVRCDTILKNMDRLDKSKVDIVPKDGVIFEEQTVTFYEGESVFNLLKREMKKNKIHMEFVNTPIYNSAYIEGIANLYEFDCGELSGWEYKVNGWFPNYGVSLYQLKQGDKVEFVYTCDLGYDVGRGIE